MSYNHASFPVKDLIRGHVTWPTPGPNRQRRPSTNAQQISFAGLLRASQSPAELEGKEAGDHPTACFLLLLREREAPPTPTSSIPSISTGCIRSSVPQISKARLASPAAQKRLHLEKITNGAHFMSGSLSL